MKASLADLLSRLPGPATAEWPAGEPFAAWVVFWGPQGE